jgi:hypothetical protein
MKKHYRRRVIGCWNDKFAQERNKMERRQHRIEMENLNSERNELMLKKMTLN